MTCKVNKSTDVLCHQREDRYLRAFLQSQPFHSQEVSMSNFPCSLTRNITSYGMKILALRSLLRSKMVMLSILTTSAIHLRSRSRREMEDHIFAATASLFSFTWLDGCNLVLPCRNERNAIPFILLPIAEWTE